MHSNLKKKNKNKKSVSCSKHLNPTIKGISSPLGQLSPLYYYSIHSLQSPVYVFVPQTVDEGVQHGCDNTVHQRGYCS